MDVFMNHSDQPTAISVQAHKSPASLYIEKARLKRHTLTPNVILKNKTLNIISTE